MRFEMPIRPRENMKSAIVNCLCPECGGAIDLSTDQFRCRGLCGKDWRPAWNLVVSGRKQARQRERARNSDNKSEVKGNHLFLRHVVRLRATGGRPGTLLSELFCGPDVRDLAGAMLAKAISELKKKNVRQS